MNVRCLQVSFVLAFFCSAVCGIVAARPPSPPGQTSSDLSLVPPQQIKGPRLENPRGVVGSSDSAIYRVVRITFDLAGQCVG
jgi:hypothetical protein